MFIKQLSSNKIAVYFGAMAKEEPDVIIDDTNGGRIQIGKSEFVGNVRLYIKARSGSTTNYDLFYDKNLTQPVYTDEVIDLLSHNRVYVGGSSDDLLLFPQTTDIANNKIVCRTYNLFTATRS